MGARQFFAGLKMLTHSEGTVDAEGVTTPGRVRIATVTQIAAGVVMTFGVLLELSTKVPLIRDAMSSLSHLTPWAPLIVLAGFWTLLPAAGVVGVSHARDDAGAADTEALWGAYLAAVLSISQNEWFSGSGAFEFSPAQDRLTVTNVPIAARTKLDAVEAKCALIIPGWTVISATFDRVELGRIEDFPEVAAARAAMTASAGLVVGFHDLPDSTLRPAAALWKLAEGRVTAAQIDALAVSQGLRLVDFREYQNEAIVARLGGRTQQVRRRLAGLLGKAEHEVELEIAMTGGRIETVTVERSPNLGLEAEKRLTIWRNLIEAIPGGSNGWIVNDDSITGRVVLTYGEPRVLREMVPMAEILPPHLAPEEWATLPLGIDAAGKVVSIDLANGPHSVIAGPTGSGKTVALLQLMASAIARGHQVVLIDPTKGGLDFAAVRPWTVAWATESLEAAQAAMERVYAEVGRRKAILAREGEVKWSDFSTEVRETENVRPILIVVDELGSLVLLEDVPKGLPKTDPYVVEAETRNAARSIIRSLLGRVAREARFAGLHLAVALQRPDAAILGGELRSNLTSAVQLAPPGKPISREAMTMLIPGDQGPVASAALSELDDGKSRGLAVIASDGGKVTGFRVAYEPAKTIPALLEALGVPKPDPWIIGATATTALPVIPVEVEPEFRLLISDQTVVTEDLGVLEVDFDFSVVDDFDEDPPAPPAKPAAFAFSFDD
ncbi:FtsK/SpoIIIE domain-containing protein [Frigoribacterium sp. UYMn621]|uniref:FtsK/SpoIIIE domain-containing protein n=1 Tax=Frigoribacterium sp. UYMn621 TaxID=3156343 RepID=UPI003396839A